MVTEKSIHLSHRAISAALVLLLALFSLFATAAVGQHLRDGRNVVLEGDLTGVQFTGGETVLVKANIADDLFAAGRFVTLDGATAGNTYLAAYEVDQRSGSVGDLVAIAHTVILSGSVEDDLLSAARVIRIASAATIGGDARLAAESMDIEGKISGNLRVAAKSVTISGEITGTVDLLAQKIVIGPNAVINGDVTYRSEAEPEIAEGAKIVGSVTKVESNLPEMRSIVGAIIGVVIGLLIGWVVAFLVLTAVLAWAFVGYFSIAANRLVDRPWASLGIGIAILIVGAVLSLLLFISIVGIPLGVALFVAIGIVKLFGSVTVSACVGLYLRGLLRRSAPPPSTAGRTGWTVIGAVILGLVMLIPFVGVVISGLAVVAGAGAASVEAWRRLRLTTV